MFRISLFGADEQQARGQGCRAFWRLYGVALIFRLLGGRSINQRTMNLPPPLAAADIADIEAARTSADNCEIEAWTAVRIMTEVMESSRPLMRQTGGPTALVWYQATRTGG